MGDEPLVIGRASDGADGLGGDAELSRLHARITEVEGRLVIEDLGSSSGTFVNARRIGAPTVLRAGDSIKLGTTTLTLEGLPEPEVTAARPIAPDVTVARPTAAPVKPSAAGSEAQLRVVAGRSSGTSIPLTAEPFVIGRGESDTATLGGDPELSRRHAQVTVVDGRVVLEDLGSRNGSFVNGRRIPAPTVVEAGDAIWVGTTTLMVAAPDAPDAGVPPSPPPAPSGESGLLSRFADLSDRHPGRFLGAIGVFFVIAAVIGGPVAGLMHADDPFNNPDSETVQTNKRIAQASTELPGAQVIALITPKGGVGAAGTRKQVEGIAREIRREPKVTRTLTFYDTRNRDFISKDRRSTYVAAFFKDLSDKERDDAAKAIEDRVTKPPEVIVGGNAVAGGQLGAQIGMDLGLAEGLAFPLLFALSLFVFRGVVAALMPLFVGGLTVMTTFLVLRIVNGILPLSQFALNIVVGLGLGLSIDYSLFVVSRYREELVKVGSERPSSKTYGAIPRSEAEGAFVSTESEALRRAMYTAGRTILYSAVTVAIALATLCMFPQPFMYSMGIGGAITALVAVSVALIALPAMLAVLGPRINSLAPASWARAAERNARQERQGPWFRLSQAVMKRPATVAAVSAALLLVVGLPATGIKFTGVDSSAIPKKLTSRQVDDALTKRFPVNGASQITVLVKAPRTQRARIGRLARQLRALPGAVARGNPPRALEGGYFDFEIVPKRRPLGAKTVALVKRIRARDGPLPVSVSGPTASFLDQKASISSRLPVVAVFLCLATVIVLFLMTGSLILPFKSLLMNALSLSAAFGLLVLIFQDGRLEGVLGYESLGALDLSQPVLLFAVAFGLATDYAVFLLTRIKEARDAGASETDAVAIGLERTGRIVTQAALLFCVAIGAFATSSIIFIKEVGVGTALAVIIDATIIRALLVPSLMALLGARNWWAPAPLRRLHEKIGLSEG